MSEKITLSARDLSAGYGSKIILSDIYFDLAEGQIVSLIGPNGSGKSTLLKTLMGDLPLIKGAVLLEGRELGTLSRSEIAKSMAVMMTGNITPEWMTCREMAASGRYPFTGLMGKLRAEDIKAVGEAMELTGTDDLASFYISEISDGQRQRVLLAKAICQEPRVLILDEPTTFLDIRYKLEFLDLLRVLAQKRHMTILMSLHELELVRLVSDRIICLKNSRMDADGGSEILNDIYLRNLYDIREGEFPEYRII